MDNWSDVGYWKRQLALAAKYEAPSGQYRRTVVEALRKLKRDQWDQLRLDSADLEWAKVVLNARWGVFAPWEPIKELSGAESGAQRLNGLRAAIDAVAERARNQARIQSTRMESFSNTVDSMVEQVAALNREVGNLQRKMEELQAIQDNSPNAMLEHQGVEETS